MAAWRHSSPQEPSQPYPHTGTRRHGGYRRLFAYISMKVRGTRTPETGTTEECSSPRTPGRVFTVEDWQAPQPRASSFIGHGSSIVATATHGESGEPPQLADSGELPITRALAHAPLEQMEPAAVIAWCDQALAEVTEAIRAEAEIMPRFTRFCAWERANREALRSVDESES